MKLPVAMKWKILQLSVLLFVPVSFAIVYASGDKTIQTTDVNTSTDISMDAGDLSITGGSSKALGLGRSSFDVDINQCMGSTSWDTILGGKQKLVINWVCLAEFYLKTGQPDLAAMAICNTEMLDEFDSEKECEAAHDFFIEVAQAAVIMVETVDDDEEDEQRHDADIEKLTEQLAQYGAQQQQLDQQQQIQQQQYNKIQQSDELRQKKLDLIEREFGKDE